MVRVFAHGSASFALHSDGTLSAWGQNNDGMLGTGDAVSSHLPRPVVGLAGVIQLAAGTHHSLALTADGQLYVWGESAMLGLGLASPAQMEPFAHPELVDIVWIAAAEDRALAVHEDGRVSAWGYIGQELGRFATTVWTYEPVAVAGLTDALAVFAGPSHSLALLGNGSLVDWGFNDEWQLSVNLPFAYGEFVQIPTDKTVIMASSGSDTSLAVLDDGTVLSWGASYTGVSGAHRYDAVPIPTVIDTLSNVTAVSGGLEFSLALDEAGNVWSWGYGIGGSLGHGDSNTRATPEMIVSTMPPIKDISAGVRHSLAIDETGDVWAWGQGANGRLGDGGNIPRSAPVQVIGLPLPAVAVSAGDTHSLAVLSDGTVWAWGANWAGQLGDGTSDYSATPKPVSGLTGIVELSASYETVLTRTATGEVYGWGANGRGQLGYWYPVLENEPQKLLPPLDVTSLFAGTEHTFIVAGGRLYGAGSDADRLLGMGQVLERAEPAPVLIGVPLAAASSGH